MRSFRRNRPSDRARTRQSCKGNRIPAVWYTDINVSYDVTEQIQGYVGVNNLFDVRPPETFQGAFDTTGTNTITDVYDPIGMFIYGGVNLKM